MLSGQQGKTPVKRSRPDIPIRDRNRKRLERDGMPELEKVTIMIIMKSRICLWRNYKCYELYVHYFT